MGKHLSIDHFGARPGSLYTGGSMTGNVFTLPGAGFTAADTGSTVVVPGALGAGVDPLVGVGTYVNPTTLTLSVPATTAVSGVSGFWGPNNTAKILEAVANARKRNIGSLLVPSGYWGHGGEMLEIFDGFTFYGMGRTSVLVALDFLDSAIYANGRENVTVRDLGFRSFAATRGQRSETGAVWFLGCAGVTLRNLYVRGGKAAGAYVDNCDAGDIENFNVRDTMADGLHIVGGSRHLRVRGVDALNTGDDGLAVVSYLSQPQCYDVRAWNVTTRAAKGRGIAFVGSRDCSVDGFYVEAPHAHGLGCMYESATPAGRVETHTPSNCRFANGEVYQAKGGPSLEAGMNGFLFTGEDSGHIVVGAELHNVKFRECNQGLISFASSPRLRACTFLDGIYNGVKAQDAIDVRLTDNIFKNIQASAITFLRVSGGRFDGNDLTECQSVTADGGAGRVQIVDSPGVLGRDNVERRTATLASAGPVSISGAREGTHIELLQLNTLAAAGARVNGMQYSSAPGVDQLHVGHDEEISPDRIGISSKKGLAVKTGDVMIMGADGSLIGEGDGMRLRTGGGFPRLQANSSIEIDFARAGGTSGKTFIIKIAGLNAFAITDNGSVYLLNGIYFGGQSTSKVTYGVGAPSAPTNPPTPGAKYIDIAGPIDAMEYIGSPGPTSTWVPQRVTGELPGDGAVDNVLHLTGVSSPRAFSFKPLDLSKAASAQIAGASGRFLRRKPDGALEPELVGIDNANAAYVPGGLGDFIVNDGAGAASFLTSAAVASLIAVELDLFAILADLQAQIDTKADIGHTHSGTTGGASAGTAHTHSISL